MVDLAGQALFLKFGVAHLGPRLPPVFQRFRAAPVGGGNRVKEGLALAVQYAVAVLVQTVDAPLLEAPLAILPDRPDGAKHMEVGVWYATILLVGLVYGKVHHHAPADKLLQQKLPCEGDVFLQRKLVLQGNIKAVRKLGVLVALHFLYGVPQGLAVLVFRRRSPAR